MVKKKTLPSNQFIESKKGNFKNIVEKIASGETTVESKKETLSVKLMLIKDELLLLKDKKIPYSILCKIIEENLDLKVSEQTLRSFCQSKLGFPKQSRKTKDKSIKKNIDSFNANESLTSTKDFD